MCKGERGGEGGGLGMKREVRGKNELKRLQKGKRSILCLQSSEPPPKGLALSAVPMAEPAAFRTQSSELGLGWVNQMLFTVEQGARFI